MLSLSCYENAIGESGSGKTESTNFLLHHLTALSQKGSQGCGVEQTILSAGPVLEVRSPIIFHFLLFLVASQILCRPDYWDSKVFSCKSF